MRLKTLAYYRGDAVTLEKKAIKAVRKTSRDEKLQFVFRAEPERIRLPMGHRAGAQVDHHIQYLSFDGADQFGLRCLSDLIVQAAQHAEGRAGLVVLYKFGRDTGLVENLTVVAFIKIAAPVGPDTGFENNQALNRGCFERHIFLFVLKK